jgi:PAS domain S-box-containing protein
VLAGTLNLNRPDLAGAITPADATNAPATRIEVATTGPSPIYVMHPDRARLLSRAASVDKASPADTGSTTARSAVRGVDWEVRTTASSGDALAGIADAQRTLWTSLFALALLSCGPRRLGDAASAAPAPHPPRDDARRPVRAGSGGRRGGRPRSRPRRRARRPGARIRGAARRTAGASRRARALRAASPLALQRQAATLRSITEAIPAIVVVVDAEGRYRFVNSAFERWYGTPRERIIGCTLPQVLGPLEYEKTREWSDRALAGETVHFERRYQHADGIQNLAISYIPLLLDNGRADGFVGVSQDITQHRQEQGRLRQLAQRDGLTGLLNRAGFEEHLERCLDAGEGDGLALLYIDLDHFKPVNDQFGHPVGDRVLQDFAARVREAVRPTDVSARLGGDEFAVVLKGVRDLANAKPGRRQDRRGGPCAVRGRRQDAAHRRERRRRVRPQARSRLARPRQPRRHAAVRSEEGRPRPPRQRAALAGGPATPGAAPIHTDAAVLQPRIAGRDAGESARRVCAAPTRRPSLNIPPHIAVVDDEVDITRLLAGYLESQGYRVTQLHAGGALLDLMRADPPALVLLDLGLPGEDGFTIAASCASTGTAAS